MARQIPLQHWDPEDLRQLREMLAAWRSGSITPHNRGRDGSIDHEEILAPEMFVARTPSGGIPALVQSSDSGTATSTGGLILDRDRPGEAVCGIYRRLKVDGVRRLIAMGFSKTVCSLLNVAVPGGAWVTILRDKLGDWWVPSMGFEFAECHDFGTSTSTSTAVGTSTGTATPPVQGDCWWNGACGDAGVPLTFTATVTNKVGCFTAAPSTLPFSCSSPHSGLTVGHVYGCTDPSVVCSHTVSYSNAALPPPGGRGWYVTADPTFLAMPDRPILYMVVGASTTLAVNAEDGWTCGAASATFQVNDGAGNSCTVTLVQTS